MKKIIITLGIIIFGSTVLATPTSDIIPNDQPVVVTREQQDEDAQEEEIKQPEEEAKQENSEPEKASKPKTQKSDKTTKKTTTPKFVGLKIFENNKPKPKDKTKKPKNSKQDKYKCGDPNSQKIYCQGSGTKNIKYLGR